MSAIATVAMETSSSFHALDRCAFIKGPTSAAIAAIAATRLPDFLFVLNACLVATTTATTTACTINRQTINVKRTATTATTACGPTNNKQPLSRSPWPFENTRFRYTFKLDC